MFTTIVLFIAILGVLVLAHELGHFVTAKKMGAKVEEFGIGFPPRLFGIKRGETLYSLNLVPLGGFVKIKGESGEFAEEEDSFANKAVWKRSVILSAGVFMNFVMAIVLLSIGFMVGLPQVLDDLGPTAKVKDVKVQIMQVLPNSPAFEAGVLMGDQVTAIENLSVSTIEAIQSAVSQSKGEEVTMMVKRGQEQLEIKMKPIELEQTDGYGIGIALVRSGIVKYPWYMAIARGSEAAVLMTKDMAVAFYNIFKGLLIQRQMAMEISGPVGIAVITGQVAKLGFIYVLQFTAILSLNLAILNILPFPALDGGRLLFAIVEKLRRGRAINRKVEAVIHNIGFLLLMLLVVVVTYRDIVRYGGRIWGAVKGTVGL